MIFDFKNSLLAISYALDCVEHDIAGVTTNHGKRVAALSLLIGEQLGIYKDLKAKQMMCTCAIMHDCALSEFAQTELQGILSPSLQLSPVQLGIHCTLGEETVKLLPFQYELYKDFILYHHENADGTGPFSKTLNEIPLGARIIHISDIVDATFSLGTANKDRAEKITKYLSAKKNILFGKEETDALTDIISKRAEDFLNSDNINSCLDELIPGGTIECSPEMLIAFSSVFARIIDYKSHFTCTHSKGIAQKAHDMAIYYGADEEFAAKMYFAGAVHDIGKLVVDRDILEKPDKLDDTEYSHIKTHVEYTYKILSQIPGIEDITRWASHHHEKLDGSGYPFGLKANDMDRWERLMTCLDIYQALTETRPYKQGMDHKSAIEIMDEMVSKNQLDSQLVHDIDVYYR